MRRRDFLGVLSGAAAWPFPASAQTRLVIGFLSSGGPEGAAERLAPFRNGLGETGYIDGQNVTIEYRWGDGYDRMAAMASELVAKKVNVIVANGGVPAANAAKSATGTVPIIFAVGADPVALGIVASLNRPAGNVTGVTNFNLELSQRRLELLHEMSPGAKNIALLVNPATPLTQPMIAEMEAAVRPIGLELRVVKSSNEQEIESAFIDAAEWHADALVVGADAYFAGKSEQIAKLASRHALAVIGSFPTLPHAGGLMSYGGSLTEMMRQLGIYTGRVLSGTKPEELLVQQSTRLELVINLKTAKALGLSVPSTLLARADEVIE
jgi:putative ABC transport system substrate-binding protein